MCIRKIDGVRVELKEMLNTKREMQPATSIFQQKANSEPHILSIQSNQTPRDINTNILCKTFLYFLNHAFAATRINNHSFFHLHDRWEEIPTPNYCNNIFNTPALSKP